MQDHMENGNLGAAFESDRPELSYSLCIRQKLAAQFASEPQKGGKSQVFYPTLSGKWFSSYFKYFFTR